MKNVLITGCSSGYGRATALLFLEKGWNVVATMRSPAPHARESPRSDRLRLVALDVTDRDRSDAATNRRYLGDDYEIENLITVTKYVSVTGTLVARKDGTTITWVHTDHLGSIQAQTASTGLEVHRQKYRPYGEILSTSGEFGYEPRGYTGQRHDASGLVYLHDRYYDPTLGRFISPDLIIDGGDTVRLNHHAYVGNNPINATDPSGLAAVSTNANRRNDTKAKTKNDPPPPPPPPSYPETTTTQGPATNTPRRRLRRRLLRPPLPRRPAARRRRRRRPRSATFNGRRQRPIPPCAPR